ncbi:MAG TPA: hypothetical protein VHD56_07140 [Tepidisphaeraceae bacterium]|nr:hypothetical protein [Tepidisphaeraceae bacterium]
MISLFLSISMLNLLCLSIAAGLGYGVMFRGASVSPYHQLAGVISAIVCCGVHCIVFTYFIATAKWIQHAIDVKHLDQQLASPTRSFKAQAFPAALAAMMFVFLTAIAGVLRLSYGISPAWHQCLALLAIAVNIGAAAVEYRAVVRNGRVIDGILTSVNPVAGPAN